MVTLPAIDTIQRLPLQPGDVIVLKCQQTVTAEAAQRIYDNLVSTFRKAGVTQPVHALLLDGGMEMMVLSAAEVAPQLNCTDMAI